MPETDKAPLLGETVPGGKYIQGDQFVDAEGKVIEGPKPTKDEMTPKNEVEKPVAVDVKK